MSERPILAETRTPDGLRVVLFEDTWLLHILNPDGGHAELEPHLQECSTRLSPQTIENQSNGPIESGSSSAKSDPPTG
jgi:hypothetical protein